MKSVKKDVKHFSNGREKYLRCGKYGAQGYNNTSLKAMVFFKGYYRNSSFQVMNCAIKAEEQACRYHSVSACLLDIARSRGSLNMLSLHEVAFVTSYVNDVAQKFVTRLSRFGFLDYKSTF